MKKIINKIIKEYLEVFQNEEERLENLQYFIDSHEDSEITDWNNFEGHIVCSAFIYSKKEDKFFVLYHKDMQMYVYPGGHVDKKDQDPLSVAKREISEETGLTEYEVYTLNNNPLIPLDIDTHIMKKNTRLNLPKHYHFDFRYLFLIDEIKDIKIDEEESRDYKWITIQELESLSNCEVILHKIKNIVKTIKR